MSREKSRKRRIILLASCAALSAIGIFGVCHITFAGFQTSAPLVDANSDDIKFNAGGAREIIYLHITSGHPWLNNNATFFMSEFNNTTGVQKWAAPFAKDNENHVYSFYLEYQTYDEFLFVRVNPAYKTPSWGAAIWNQTKDQSFDPDCRYYTVTDQDGGDANKYCCEITSSI